MGLFRIVILAVLFYLLYKVVFSGRSSQKKDQSGERRPASDPGANDILVEDPVCHTFIPQKQAETLQDRGQTYYFCSTECRETFITNNKGV